MNSDWRTDDQGATPVSNFEASKTMGQIAFEAYWNKKGWMRRNQETIHSWNCQKADEVEAWEEVAIVLLENVTDEITNILGAMNRTHPYDMDDPEYWNRTPVK